MEKELLIRLTSCSLCILLFVILVISGFGFEGGIWVLIATVPGLCILASFIEGATSSYIRSVIVFYVLASDRIFNNFNSRCD